MQDRHVAPRYLLPIRSHRLLVHRIHKLILHRLITPNRKSQPSVSIQNLSSQNNFTRFISSVNPHSNIKSFSLISNPRKTMAATAATATAAALQQAPITFQSRTTSTFRLNSATPIKSSFTGGLRLQKLSIKLTGKSRHGNTGGGASGARMADSAAGSYAAALAEVAIGNGTLEATVKDLDQIDKLFSEKTFFDFFASPIVTLEAKRELIDKITASGKLQIHVCNFLNILIESKRIDLIKEIVKEFEIVYNKLTDTELAIVSSVVQLEEQHLAQIAKQVQKLTGAKNVRVKTVIDESLVAGFTIRYGNAGSKLIDMSVKKQLEEIAAQLEIGDISLAV